MFTKTYDARVVDNRLTQPRDVSARINAGPQSDRVSIVSEQKYSDFSPNLQGSDFMVFFKNVSYTRVASSIIFTMVKPKRIALHVANPKHACST